MKTKNLLLDLWIESNARRDALTVQLYRDGALAIYAPIKPLGGDRILSAMAFSAWDGEDWKGTYKTYDAAKERLESLKTAEAQNRKVAKSQERESAEAKKHIKCAELCRKCVVCYEYCEETPCSECKRFYAEGCGRDRVVGCHCGDLKDGEECKYFEEAEQ